MNTQNKLYEALTKSEAIKAMLEGKKVRHKYFASDEWVTLTPSGLYLFEDGNTCLSLNFWQDRRSEEWENDWFLYEQPEPSLDKLAETVLREYVKFKDVNGSKSVSLLPLTIVDMMVEFIDRVNEQPEAIAAFEQSQQEGMEAITWKKNAYESALDYLSEMGYGSGTNFTSKGVASLLADFASQQTSSKDKEIKELKAEIDRLKKEVERLESSDAWINLSDEKPIEEKMCQCYCPDEPIDIVHIGFWDNNYGFIDNNDHPVNAEKWKYVKLPLATPPTTKVKTM